MPAYPDLSGAVGALSMGQPSMPAGGPQMPAGGPPPGPMGMPQQTAPDPLVQSRPGNSSLITRVLSLIRREQPRPPITDVGDQLREMTNLGLDDEQPGGLPQQHPGIDPRSMMMIQQLLGHGAMSHMDRPAMAGAMPHFAHGGMPFVGDDGAGDGRSDHVEARLSPGEFVMDAETTSLLGNGDSAAGARKLEALRQNIRRHKGKQLARGKFSANAKTPESYLPRGALS